MDSSNIEVYENQGENLSITIIRNVTMENSIDILIQGAETALFWMFRDIVLLNPHVTIAEQQNICENGNILAVLHIETNGQVSALAALCAAVNAVYEEMTIRLQTMHGLDEAMSDSLHPN